MSHAAFLRLPACGRHRPATPSGACTDRSTQILFFHMSSLKCKCVPTKVPTVGKLQ
jgi:hypothetical protein